MQQISFIYFEIIRKIIITHEKPLKHQPKCYDKKILEIGFIGVCVS